MNDSIIEITNLNYQNIFNNFNISFPKNKFISISGSNNCGKTTLIRILNSEISRPNSILINAKKLEDYKSTELSQIIQCVIPKEISFIYKTVSDELNFTLEQNYLSKEEKKFLYQAVIKNLKLTKYQETDPNYLEDKELIKVQLALALLRLPKVLLIDDSIKYFSKKMQKEILNYLKEYQKKYNMTIIMTTNNLNDSLVSDYIYIIAESKIVLEGLPLEVLQKDNILNKLGLNIPFMIDLSVKLRDYDVINEIELDMDRMVDTLWK